MRVFDSPEVLECLKGRSAETEASMASEPLSSYGLSYDNLLEDDYKVMALSTSGLSQELFYALKDQSPFNLDEWADFLHISKRTIIRYKNESKPFETLSTDRIISITQLVKKGVEVFGDASKFNSWLRRPVYAIGSVEPLALIKSAFGIKILLNELGRIEHGILA